MANKVEKPASARHEELRQLKGDNLRRAYAAFKKAEAEGTLVKVPLTEEQRKILDPATPVGTVQESAENTARDTQ